MSVAAWQAGLNMAKSIPLCQQVSPWFFQKAERLTSFPPSFVFSCYKERFT
jgi:hypothetical protein